MKTLIKLTLILIALTLVACCDAVYESATIDVPSVEIQQPVIVVTPEPTTVAPSPVLNPPIGVTVCPQGTNDQCGNSPTMLPVRPIVIEPNPEPVCIRNNEPLVIINNALTDNCGNTYGDVTL